MSSRYKNESEVPTDVICDRLEKLSDAVTEGREAVSREFCMRIPAEVDRDADLVLSTASKRLRKMMDALNEIAGQHLREEMDDHTGENAEWEEGYEAIVKIARSAICPANEKGLAFADPNQKSTNEI